MRKKGTYKMSFLISVCHEYDFLLGCYARQVVNACGIIGRKKSKILSPLRYETIHLTLFSDN